jgi:hypothetical protein
VQTFRREAVLFPAKPRGSISTSRGSRPLAFQVVWHDYAHPNLGGAMGASDDSTSQLVQAMAGFGGAGGAADGMNSVFRADPLQQQQFLTTPQHA